MKRSVKCWLLLTFWGASLGYADNALSSSDANRAPSKLLTVGLSLGNYFDDPQPGVRLGIGFRIADETPFYLGFDGGSYLDLLHGHLWITQLLGTFFYKPRLDSFSLKLGAGLGPSLSLGSGNGFLGIQAAVMGGLEYHLSERLSAGFELMVGVIKSDFFSQPMLHLTFDL